MDVDIRGKTGFLGQALMKCFALKQADSIRRLIISAAVQPGRMSQDAAYETNIGIVRNIIEEVNKSAVDHITYVSSDAVYPFVDMAIDEALPPAPLGIYGRMHLEREHLLLDAFKDRLLIIRSTMIVGPGDPHMAYGLNRLCHDAKQKQCISLFGQGEELRDYIWLEDIAEAIVRLTEKQETGLFNLASGSSIKFMEVAELLCDRFEHLDIKHLERKQPITHRVFNNRKLRTALPDLVLKTPREQINQLLALS